MLRGAPRRVGAMYPANSSLVVPAALLRMGSFASPRHNPGDAGMGVDDLHIIAENRPFVVMLVFMAFAVAALQRNLNGSLHTLEANKGGALLRTIFKETKIPILVLIFFIGIALGIIAHFPLPLDFVRTVANIDPVLFLHLFTPAIIFTAAFEMDFYIFRKSFWQVLILAVPGFLMNCAFLAWLTYKVNKHNWTWDDSMLFGIILSTTDPVLSVASVKNIGLSKIVINLIKGESLFNDATTVIIFDMYRDLVDKKHGEVVKEIVIKLLLKFFGSAILGFLSSRIIIYWLQHIFNDGVIEVVLSFTMAYLVFFFEWLGMSGVISLCILGLLLDSVSFSPGVDLFLYRFWSMLTFLAHVMIYLIMGIVIAQKTLPFLSARLIFYIITVYISLNVVRATVVLILSPFLSRLGYGFNWRWGAVIVWSGMRGTFTLNMALALSQGHQDHSEEVTTSILLYSGTTSLFTLIINSTTVKKLVVTLGLCNITLPKRMAMHNAVQRIRQMEANAFSMLKLDRFLADANWTMAEEAIAIEYPYKLDPEETSNLNQIIHCPECNSDITFERSPQQIADLMEEARLRLLTAQMASYRKQYCSGMLNRDAAQTLIGAAESYVDIKGKFMNIHEVKTYWESKGMLVTTKKWLSDWVYNVKEEKSKPSRHRFLKLCHLIVFTDEFECMSIIITFLNLFPIGLNFIDHVNTHFLQQLRICNYYYLSLYILEAALKALAMGKAYLFHHWNQFELLIVIVGIIDVILLHLFHSVGSPHEVVSTVTVFRIIRVFRILRLFKHVIPKIIDSLDRQINKQLTFRYDIAKGYVQGEEDIKCLIGQIAGHEKVFTEISQILEINKLDAMKELGLMQRDYPDIVTSVKTKQAVQIVLNTASESLQFMISGGIVDRNEGDELHKIILRKKQQLETLPSTIAPPTAEELLRNVIWLQNDKAHIEFIQKKAKILCYDYGDVICEESELPQGIFLIVSGMTKLHGSAPRYGVDKALYDRKYPSGLAYTDYLATGAIIGELNCLTKQEMEYTVTCETAVQTCFISIDDLLEAFDKFLESPTLEYKIWLKIALDVAVKTFKENLPGQDWSYRMCVQLSNMYVLDVPNHTKCDIYDGSMEDVILVHGTVQDCQLLQHYAAPCILPKLCHQVQGTAPATKLLVIRTTDKNLRRHSGICSNICQFGLADRRQATTGYMSEPEEGSHTTLESDMDFRRAGSRIRRVHRSQPSSESREARDF